MLTCDKCGAKGFITVEGDEFHCHLCGFVWYHDISAACRRPAQQKKIPQKNKIKEG